MIRIVGLTLLFFAVFASVAQAQDLTILPGDRIGTMKLGATRSQIRIALGKPSRIFSTHGGRSADSWLQKTGRELEAVYQGGIVVQLRTGSDQFQFGKKSANLDKALPD